MCPFWQLFIKALKLFSNFSFYSNPKIVIPLAPILITLTNNMQLMEPTAYTVCTNVTVHSISQWLKVGLCPLLLVSVPPSELYRPTAWKVYLQGLTVLGTHYLSSVCNACLQCWGLTSTVPHWHGPIYTSKVISFTYVYHSGGIAPFARFTCL